MYVYCAGPFPATDCVVKCGLTGSPLDRLSQFNCSSGRRFAGVFWKVHRDPEHWEGELLRLFSKFRISRPYGASELIDAEAAFSRICELYAANCKDHTAMAWLCQAIAALAVLTDRFAADHYLGDLMFYENERVSESPVFRRCVRELNERRILLWPIDSPPSWQSSDDLPRCNKPLKLY